MIRGLTKNGFNVKILCGTRNCYHTVTSLKDVAVAARMLRLSRLVEGTPLQRLFQSQESLTLLRLWLKGRRFEYAVEAAATLAGLSDLARTTAQFSCSSILYVNHFWNAFQGLSEFQLRSLMVAPCATAVHDQNRLAALWLPGGAADVLQLTPYMRRVDAVLQMVPGRELMVAPPSDGWLYDVFCGIADVYEPAPAVQCTEFELLGFRVAGGRSSWYRNESRTFHVIGYAVHAGCRGGAGGRNEFFEGDAFQSLAVAQFLPRLDGFVDVTVDGPWEVSRPCADVTRERSWPPVPPAASNGSGQAYVVMGARWFRLGKTFGFNTTWPPPKHVIPVLVGFRVEDRVANVSELHDWFSRWGPVGTRDEATARLFRVDGVAAMNVGCTTLGFRTWLCPGRGYFPTHAPTNTGGDHAAAAAAGHVVGPFADGSLPTALAFDSPRGVCSPWEPAAASVISGVRVICGLRHNWIVENASSSSFAAFDLGAWYDLKTRAGRLQLAVNKLRAFRKADLVITSGYYHVVLPAVGMGVPPLLASPTYASLGETRFTGLEQLYTSLRYNRYAFVGDTISPEVEQAVAAARAQRLNSEGERCRLDGMLAPAGSHAGSPARVLRDELFRRQLQLLSRHEPLLDAMNRLGAVDALTDDVQAADEAWIRGTLPAVLLPSAAKPAVTKEVGRKPAGRAEVSSGSVRLGQTSR